MLYFQPGIDLAYLCLAFVGLGRQVLSTGVEQRTMGRFQAQLFPDLKSRGVVKSAERENAPTITTCERPGDCDATGRTEGDRQVAIDAIVTSSVKLTH